jgi:hypothetical protein
VDKEQPQERDAAQEETAEETWREVGRQFEALGESLSRAFRAAWESPETQEQARSMQEGLEKMVDKVEGAVREASETEQGKRLRTEAEKTAETLRAAGEQTWQEARPQLLSALRKANDELQAFIERMEQRPASKSDSA